jgi:hypothetical protein
MSLFVCVCLCLCVSVSLCACVLMCVYDCISIYCILSETVEGKLPWNEIPPPLRGPWWWQHWRGNIEPPLEGLDIPSTGNSCRMPVAPGHVRQWHTCNWNILGAGGPIGHAEMWNDGLWLMEVDERFSISVSSTQPPTISKPQSRLKTVTYCNYFMSFISRKHKE